MDEAARRDELCRSCGAVLHGPFCSACGQEVRPLDPPFAELARDLVHELSDVDGRLLRSVRQLFLAPGFLTREWFEGRRVRWVTPLRLYLTFSVAYFALVALGGSTLHFRVSGTEQQQAASLKELGFRNTQELRETLVQAQAVWMPRVNFVLVPLFAGLVALVRRGSGRRYPQHLIFALHSQAAWFGARTLAAAGALIPLAAVGQLLDSLTTLYGIGFLVIAFRTAYGVTTRRAIRDTAIVLVIYGVCVIVATAAVLLPIVFWNKLSTLLPTAFGR